jgi:hypothetical protein
MEVHIQDVIATVRAVSTDSVLAPKTLEKIVSTVLGAVRADQEHKDRLKNERSLTGSGRPEGEA